MDPNAALAQIRTKVAVFDSCTDPHDQVAADDPLLNLVSEFLDLVSGLDHYLSGGGILPAAWAIGRTPDGAGR